MGSDWNQEENDMNWKDFAFGYTAGVLTMLGLFTAFSLYITG